MVNGMILNLEILNRRILKAGQHLIDFVAEVLSGLSWIRRSSDCPEPYLWKGWESWLRVTNLRFQNIWMALTSNSMKAMKATVTMTLVVTWLGAWHCPLDSVLLDWFNNLNPELLTIVRLQHCLQLCDSLYHTCRVTKRMPGTAFNTQSGSKKGNFSKVISKFISPFDRRSFFLMSFWCLLSKDF